MVCTLLRLPVTEVEVNSSDTSKINPCCKTVLSSIEIHEGDGRGVGEGAGSNRQECKLTRHKAPKALIIKRERLARGLYVTARICSTNRTQKYGAILQSSPDPQ